MIIKDKLRQFRSENVCNLEMFKTKQLKHDRKVWVSRDGTKHLIVDMDTMHLWHTFRMLLRVIELEDNYLSYAEPQGEMAQMMAEREMAEVMERAAIARNALQYIGHELYKREANVPQLPKKNIKSRINRADNLNRGYVDSNLQGLTWYDGEFYKY